MFIDASEYATGHDDTELRQRKNGFQKWLEEQIAIRYCSTKRPRTIRVPLPDEYNDLRIYQPVLALCRGANWRADAQEDPERGGEAKIVVLDCGRVPVSPV